MRKLCLFIACSLDGYIAQQHDDLSFLQLVEQEGEDYGYAAFNATIDTLIIGRKTYDWVKQHIGTAHYDNGDRDVYVITRTERKQIGRIIFHTKGLISLINTLKAQEGKNIYCDGGAEVINALLKEDLIDEMTLSIIPILLGNGTRLFHDSRPEQLLQLVDSKSFPTGVVQVQYSQKINNI